MTLALMLTEKRSSDFFKAWNLTDGLLRLFYTDSSYDIHKGKQWERLVKQQKNWMNDNTI
jgi:hypothetical protein